MTAPPVAFTYRKPDRRGDGQRTVEPWAVISRGRALVPGRLGRDRDRGAPGCSGCPGSTGGVHADRHARVSTPSRTTSSRAELLRGADAAAAGRAARRGSRSAPGRGAALRCAPAVSTGVRRAPADRRLGRAATVEVGDATVLAEELAGVRAGRGGRSRPPELAAGA